MKKNKDHQEAAENIREILTRRPELLDRLDPFQRIVCEAILQTPLKEKGDITAANKEAEATASASKG
jgi:hypothetical protein